MFEKDQHVEKKSFFYTHILNFVVLHRHMTMLADIQICVYTHKSTHARTHTGTYVYIPTNHRQEGRQTHRHPYEQI